ncbi:MAG: hypothetical protein AAGG11_16125, partial [Pseudomonadota bacterium]
YERVWFHIDPSNLRSQAATKKIGAHFVRDEVNSLSADGRVWKCYALHKMAGTPNRYPDRFRNPCIISQG